MAYTVTATQSGSSSDVGVFLLVRVLTNATEAGGATSGNRDTGGAASQGSLTPNFSASWVGFSISGDNFTTGMPAAASNNTYDQSAGNTSHGWSAAQGHYTGTVTASTPLTYGAGSADGSQDHSNWCAYEVPASGGTITVDGSSPAGVNNQSAAAAVTASFTPPAPPYVLAAMVAAGGTGSGTGITVTMSDTSGLGLTWTRRAISLTTDNYQPTYVFTASVGGPAGTPATLASGAGAALNPAVVTSNINVGPNYAGVATDLGGGYGAWGTPQYAEGGP